MKSYAIMLGAAVCLAGMAAQADEAKYWEKRDVDPESDAPTRATDSKAWEQRDVTPASEDAKRTDKKYWTRRDTNPGDVDDEREVEDVLNKKAEVKKSDRDHSLDRKGIVMNDPDDKKLGIAFIHGGGIGGFIDDSLSESTSAQGQWTSRLVIGTRTHFAGELAYVGSAQKVNALGVSANSMLYGNGAEGAFRVNVLTGMWQPYAIGGLGWVHYNLNRDALLTTSDVQHQGDVMTFPVGAGMSWRMNNIMVDSRLSFHPATTSGIIRGANMSTWDLQARAGFEF